jgi:hypothetical protein
MSCRPYLASSGGGISHTPAAVCDRSPITSDHVCRFHAFHLSLFTFHPLPFALLRLCVRLLPSLVAAFQGGNGAGDNDAADTADLAQSEMLGQHGVAEDG